MRSIFALVVLVSVANSFQVYPLVATRQQQRFAALFLSSPSVDVDESQEQAFVTVPETTPEVVDDIGGGVNPEGGTSPPPVDLDESQELAFADEASQPIPEAGDDIGKADD